MHNGQSSSSSSSPPLHVHTKSFRSKLSISFIDFRHKRHYFSVALAFPKGAESFVAVHGFKSTTEFLWIRYSPRTLSSNSSIVQTKWHLRTWEGSALKSVTDFCVPAKRQPSPIQLLAFSTTQSSVCVQALVQTSFSSGLHWGTVHVTTCQPPH